MNNSIKARDAVMAGLAEAERTLAKIRGEWTADEQAAALGTVIRQLNPNIQAELKKRAPQAFKRIGGK